MLASLLRHLRRDVAALLILAVLITACAVTTESLENVTLSDAVEQTTPPDQSSNEDVSPAPTADADADADNTEPDDPTAAPDPTAGTTNLDPATIGADGVGDNYYPGYGNGGYDVADYKLSIDWDHDQRTMDSVATIELTTTMDLAQFNFDLIGFDVSEIRVNSELATFERQGRELIIRPAELLPDGEQATVEISYQGEPTLLESLGAPFSTGWTDLGDTIIVAGEPEGASGWYPVNEHPLDKATYTVEVTTDADLTVASNGTQESVTENGDEKTWVYRSANPQASYLTTLAIGDFRRHDGAPSESGVPVRHYFHESVFDDSVATMERTGQMIDAYEAIFGPYPFENYGAVVVDAGLGFALETQTLSVFGADLVDEFATREDIVAHELVHQWFGNHISLGQWSDIWLNEGFATYGEYLWFDAIEPNFDIDQAVRNDYDQLGFLLQVPPGAPPANDLFNASVYLRGAFTLHALRTTIGDDAFFQLVSVYVEEFGGSTAVTSEFISLAEDVSGQDLASFFQGWLYDEQMPPLPE